MTIRARFLAEKPGDIVFTMKITMTADEWERLRDGLNAARDRALGNYECNRVISAIDSVLADARRIYWSDDDGKDALE